MPLPIPTLDDLTWFELVEEARDRIPSIAGRWTDHNAHDPGITVLELMAWACEQVGYRIDQIPVSHRQAFLALLGATREPPTSAAAVLETKSKTPIAITPGWRVVAEVQGVAVSFVVSSGAQSSLTRVVELRSEHASGTPRTSLPSSGLPFEPLGPDGESTFTIALSPAAPSGRLTLWFESAYEIEMAQSTHNDACPAVQPGLTLTWECRDDQGWRALRAAGIEDRTTCLTRSGTISLDLGAPGVTMLRCRAARGRYDRTPALIGVVSNAVVATASSAGAAANLPAHALWSIILPAVLTPAYVSLSAPFRRRQTAVTEKPSTTPSAEPRCGCRLTNDWSASLPPTAWTHSIDCPGRKSLPQQYRPVPSHCSMSSEWPSPRPEPALARVRAFADLDLNVRCADAPGTVSVIIVPYLPIGRPAPTDELLSRVTRHLADRKTLGTRIRVFGPGYTSVDVAASVTVTRGIDRQRAKATIEQAIRIFLDPVVGGPGGRGWPFGRDVYRTEIMALVGELPGVELVTDVRVASDSTEACANACVPDGNLVRVGSLDVEVI